MTSLALFCLICTASVFGQKLDLTVHPSTVIVGGNVDSPSFTATCRIAGDDITSIAVIELQKTGYASDTKLAVLTKTDNTPTIQEPSIADRSTVSGSISGNRGDLVLHLTSLVCSDGGQYYCFASYVTSANQDETVRRNVVIEAKAESLMIERVPHLAEYPINKEIALRCSGNIGNRFDPDRPDQSVKWETKLPGEQFWTPYTEGITYSTQDPSTNNCQIRWVSVLTRKIIAHDNGRQFKCSVFDESITVDTTLKTGLDTSGCQSLHERCFVSSLAVLAVLVVKL